MRSRVDMVEFTVEDLERNPAIHVDRDPRSGVPFGFSYRGQYYRLVRLDQARQVWSCYRLV